MDYSTVDLIVGVAGSAAGVFGYNLYYHFLKPLREASKMSGIPLRDLDINRAINLGKHTRSWRSFIDNFWYEPHLTRDFPEEVDNARRKNLNMNGVPITIDFVGDQSTPLPVIWDAQRERTWNFYHDPAVQAYLKRPIDVAPASAEDAASKGALAPIRQLDDLRLISID